MTRAAMVMIGVLLASAPLFAQRSTGSKSDAAATPAAARQASRNAVSFRRDLLPLFRDNCTMCHQGDIPMGALSLTPDAAYQSLVGMQSAQASLLRVVAGKPERSYLYYKVSGQNARVNGGGFGMPWGQQLSASDVDLIRRWIKQGAKDN